MALSKTHEYELINTELNGNPIQKKVIKFDFRRATATKRNLPENLYKRRYLTRGGLQSGFTDNDSSTSQQFISLLYPYTNKEDIPEVIGYFEYDISLIPSQQTITEQDSESVTYDAEGNIITAMKEVAFSDDCLATITEMMSYSDKYSLIFGMDLYYLLEHCFTEPIPEAVYVKLKSPPEEETTVLTENLEIPTISRVEWLVFRDNPAEELYDMLVIKMGGTIILPTRSGQLKKYVINKNDFMEKAYRGNKE